MMIDAIADRCDVLPWELCVMFIDEIDGIAPARVKQSTEEHSVNLLN